MNTVNIRNNRFMQNDIKKTKKELSEEERKFLNECIRVEGILLNKKQDKKCENSQPENVVLGSVNIQTE